MALAGEGLDVLAIGPSAFSQGTARDPRTAALFSGSITFLRHLDAWNVIEPEAVPLVGLRLIDDTGGVLRAPEILFRAEELGLTAFGYNIANAALLQALLARAGAVPNLRLVDGEAISVDFTDRHAEVSLADGSAVRGQVIVGADGRKSLVRTCSGIETRSWTYPQSAIAASFRHSRPHGGVSTELHRRSGPLTTVPLAGDSSSLVWVETPSEAQRIMEMTPEQFARTLEGRLQGLLGTIGEVGPRALFPLSGLTATSMARSRVALVGESAHVLPPIGAQGLNLGLRDAATLAEVLSDAHAADGDPGSNAVLAEYDRRRSPDVTSRTVSVDLLNRSLISDMLPLHLARGAGLHALEAVPWLRRLVMQEGMQPSWALPRLMRPSLGTPASAPAP